MKPRGNWKRFVVGSARRFRRAWRVLVAKPETSVKQPQSADIGLEILAGTVLFDAEYYAEFTGLSFSSRERAARHFIKGMPRGALMHPLIEVRCLPERVQRSYRRRDVGAVVTYLRSGASARHRLGALLDPRCLDVDNGVSVESAEQAIAWLGDDRPLPMGAGQVCEVPTLGQIRPDLARAARDITDGAAKFTRPWKTTWEVEAEKQWRRENGLTPLGGHPGVDIVMAVKNGAHSISDAIASIQRQEFHGWTLWVINDGSEDDTEGVVAELAAADARIRLVNNEGEGVTAARNTGIRSGTGQITAFLDADNTWRPDFLMLAVGALEVKDVQWVYTAMRLDDGQGGIRFLGVAGGHDRLVLRNHIDLNTLVVRTSILTEVGGFSADLKRWVDHDLALKLAARYEPVYLPFIGCDYDNSPSPTRITRRESPAWESVVLGRHQLPLIDRKPMVRDRWTVVLTSSVGRPDSTLTSVASVLESADAADIDVEVVVLDHGSSAQDSYFLFAGAVTDARTRIVRAPRRYSTGLTWAIGRAHSSGEYLCILPPDSWIQVGTLGVLREGLRETGVVGIQPVVTWANGSLASAGLHRIDGRERPAAILFDMYPESVAHVDGIEVHALGGGVLITTVEDFDAVGGMDLELSGAATLQDVSRRLSDRGRLRLLSAAVVTLGEHTQRALDPWADGDSATLARRWSIQPGSSVDARELLAPTGLRPSDLDVAVVDGLWTQTVRTTAIGVDVTERPRLRWAIKIGVRNTRSQEFSGEALFAANLSQALRGLGQDVAVVRADDLVQPASHLDDVVLAVRGEAAVPVMPGVIQILWVLSSPESIRPHELASADHVFVASETWAKTARRYTRSAVTVLHHATDPTCFNPSRSTETGPDIAFVGDYRSSVGTQIVRNAVDAGGDVVVWGHGWETVLPSRSIGGLRVGPDRLAELYASSRIVLTDHQPTARRHGFINSETFDAVASGARVVTDPVDDIASLFDGAVQTYSSIDELSELLKPSSSSFPDDERMRDIATRIQRENSFDRRAAVLLETALSARARGLDH